MQPSCHLKIYCFAFYLNLFGTNQWMHHHDLFNTLRVNAYNLKMLQNLNKVYRTMLCCDSYGAYSWHILSTRRLVIF